MYTDLGHYYAWADPWKVDELTFMQVEMYLARLPEFEYRRMYGLARVRRQVQAVQLSLAGEGQLPEWGVEFPGWARGEELGDREPPPYCTEFVAAFELALKHKLVSAAMLRRLDSEKLRKSGWKG